MVLKMSKFALKNTVSCSQKIGNYQPETIKYAVKIIVFFIILCWLSIVVVI